MLNFVSDVGWENTCKEKTRFPKGDPALRCSDIYKEVYREYKEYNLSDRISESNDKCHTSVCKVRINIYVSCCSEEVEEEEEE